MTATNDRTILTVGHSNRTIEDFLELLNAHNVELIADVRKLPGSRMYPHFNSEDLAMSLRGVGIAYVHVPGLGGRRKGAAESPNDAWRNASFRAYADYMQTPEFDAELSTLLAEYPQRIALMCSEAVPWRCHRSLIADALVVRGYVVEHIMTTKKRDRHELREWARVAGIQITYPATADAQQTLFKK